MRPSDATPSLRIYATKSDMYKCSGSCNTMCSCVPSTISDVLTTDRRRVFQQLSYSYYNRYSGKEDENRINTMLAMFLCLVSCTGKPDSRAPTPMQEMNVALKECKFGFFHIRLLFTSLVAVTSCVLVSNSTAYLLPTAECDLEMNLLQKGILNAMPYVGMLLSSIVSGFLTDTFGRKLFLLTGYGGIFLFTIISASSQTYDVLVVAKFFEGLFFAMAFSPTVTLTSEFCPNEWRDRVMLTQSSFAAVAQVIIAAMSWQILIRDWKFSLFGGFLVFNTWNIYLYICSLWSLAALILYALLPESPKYLLSQQKYDEARAVLIQVYTENTRKPADTYPCAYLWKKKSQQVIEEIGENPLKSGLRHQLAIGLANAKPVFQKPLVLYLMQISSMILLCMSMYNVIRLWFPQLSTIIEHSSMGSSNVTQDLCEMLDAYTYGLKMTKFNLHGESEVCVPSVSGTETYINSIVMGSVCFAPYLVSGVLVNKAGKKCLFLASGVITIGVSLGLRWSNTQTAIVALFSISVALTQTMISLLQAICVEFFPTTTRTLAISILMMVGRIGTLIGNISFPILLDMGCVIPFYTFAAVMALVTILATFLPVKK